MCSNKTFAWGLSQIKEWLAANPDDVVEIFLDNRVPPWNIDIVTNALTATFGAALLTPRDLASLFNGTWPSRDGLLAAGNRVICESNSY